MDNETFKQNALRTESNDFPKIKARLQYSPVGVALIAELKRTAVALERLDEIKKYLFYGKESKFLTNFESEEWHLMKNGLAPTVESFMEHVDVIQDSEQMMRLLHGVIGINTEGGELIEAFLSAAKTNEIDTTNIMEEIGDVNWYEAIISDALGFEVGEANERVIKKLRNRFPHKFTEGHAINRDLGTERKTLEGQE